MKMTRERLSQRVGDYEVASDGNKVWVNSAQGCVARWCPVSHEIFSINENYDHNMRPTWAHWLEFTKRVKSTLGVEVGPQHLPECLNVQ